MQVTVNVRHLEEGTVAVEGEVSAKELELDTFQDPLVAVKDALHYDLVVEKHDIDLYVHGSLNINLDCNCKRCLKPFKFNLQLKPYDLYVPLIGEDAAPVLNDLVDLTPYFREDTLLAFPQHPLCSEDCKGIANVSVSTSRSSEKSTPEKIEKTAWSALDKLKF
jgi:uncharacterized protein